MLGSGSELPQSCGDLGRRSRISQLSGELRDPLSIAPPCPTNSYGGSIHDGTPLLKILIRVEEDCDRAFIDQLHRHHRLKNSGSYANAKPAQGFIEFLIQRSRKLRRRRGNEARAALPARVTVQSEL